MLTTPAIRKFESSKHLATVARMTERSNLFNQEWFPKGLRNELRFVIFGCSRFCAAQSTSDPQGSTKPESKYWPHSFQSTWKQQFSIGFNKPYDLLWEQRVGHSNPSVRQCYSFDISSELCDLMTHSPQHLNDLSSALAVLRKSGARLLPGESTHARIVAGFPSRRLTSLPRLLPPRRRLRP